ncbi:MAG: dual specificity protein phosphatase family protein [Patescibacteria group bacterium]
MTHPLKTFDYNEIIDAIFIGNNMCCQADFEKELLNQGVAADISLEEEKIDSPIGVDYFLWLPTKNHYAPDNKKLELGVTALDFFVKNKIKVYVHCKNGHGRAPTLVAAYFISKGMTKDQAINLLTSKRPGVHLNDKQIKALDTFEQLRR